MAKINSNFISALIDGFTKTSMLKSEQKNQAEMRKLQTKMFEKQLEAEDLKSSANKQIFDKMKGVESLPQDFTGPPQEVPKKSLLDLLSDPQGQSLLMQAGTKPETIVNMQTYANLMNGGGQIPEGFELQGVKYDTKGRPMFDFGKPKMDEPVSPSASAGYVDTEGKPAPPGLSLRQLQEGGYRPKGPDITPAEAGKITALNTASGYVKDLSDTILDPKLSKTDKAILLTNMAAATPKTKGRELHYKVRDAIDAVFRARTGAAAPESEAAAIIAQFMPSPFDTDDGIKDKLMRFDKFVGGAFDIITLPENVRRKLEGGAAQGTGGKVIDFSELP